MKFILSLFISLATAVSVFASPYADEVVIPKPVKTVKLKGSCKIDAVPKVNLVQNFEYGAEGYILEITGKGIQITAGTDAGAFYAQQTLDQIVRACNGKKIPAQKVIDYPRFGYRGVMLDVSRQFFDKEFVKKQLKMFAQLKFNRFHFHLVDGAGWRIEIDRYPLLTQISAWRPMALYSEWKKKGEWKFCDRNYKGAYGGYYTKDELREIVAFADSLHIVVIPEIEMFGHSSEVTPVYPEVACGHSKFLSVGDGTYENGKSVYCIGKEKTFEFLQNIIDEVLEIFPSEYIHIGGDEANKRHWKACPDCQKRIADNHLDGEDGLQSYGISRMEKYINSKGRQIIGWDEILEGGLAPNAAVMSWRGESGGKIAAASGHKVVMSPNTYCYLDKCQGNPLKEPFGYGGFLRIAKTYSYNPAPDTLKGKEYIIGVQGNLWTEYVPTEEHVEHMFYPRTFAISEIGWTPQEMRNYDDFYPRAVAMSKYVNSQGYSVYDMTQGDDVRVGYDTDVEHLARGCNVTYLTKYSREYAKNGAAALVDGKIGGYGLGDRWQGWQGKDCSYIVDLGSEKSFSSISTTFGQWGMSQIMIPEKMTFEISSDGENYKTVYTEDYIVDWDYIRPFYHTFTWNGKEKARYIKVTGKIDKKIPGWLFTDEIIVK